MPVQPAFTFATRLAYIGIALRIIDRFILRPEVVGANIDVVAVGGTLTGLAASLLYPIGIGLGPIALIVRERLSRRQRTLAYIAFIFPMIDVALVGKRGIAISLIGMAILAAIAARRIGSLRSVIIMASLGTASLGMFGYIFARRLASYSFGICTSLYNSAYSFTMKPAGVAEVACGSTTGSLNVPIEYGTNFAMYYLHGLYEYALLHAQQGDSSALTWGRDTFGIGAKLLCTVTRASNCDANDVAFRPGVYTSFWGPLLRDFGPWTALFALLFGVLVGFVYSLSTRSISWIPLYAWLGTVLFFIPVVNLIQSGLGLYIAWGTAVFGWIFQRMGSGGVG